LPWGTSASDPGHVLGVLSENGKLFQHEADLGVSLDQLGEVRRALAAIGAVIVEEGNDAHIAFRVAGDKARRRAEDLFGMGGDPPLLPQRTDIEEAGIGHDRA
jgi:hypothetical protein